MLDVINPTTIYYSDFYLSGSLLVLGERQIQMAFLTSVYDRLEQTRLSKNSHKSGHSHLSSCLAGSRFHGLSGP